MAFLFGLLAVLALLFALPGGKRSRTDRSLFQFVGILSAAAALGFAKLGAFGLVLALVGAGLFLISWYRGQTLAGLEDENAGTPPRGWAASTDPAGMNREEALSVLGLEGDPTEDAVNAAHRRMISGVHPDKGGSDYLAAKINQARDCLLQK